jgi:hypothetical protein
LELFKSIRTKKKKEEKSPINLGVVFQYKTSTISFENKLSGRQLYTSPVEAIQYNKLEFRVALNVSGIIKE